MENERIFVPHFQKFTASFNLQFSKMCPHFIHNYNFSKIIQNTERKDGSKILNIFSILFYIR